MNWIQSKIARMRIRRRWYFYQRREMMIENAGAYSQLAVWHFHDKEPWKYYDALRKETMFRRRVAWYSKKMREKGQNPVYF